MKYMISAAFLFVSLIFSFSVFAEVLPVVDVNNTLCVVSGEDVSGKHFAEFEGKRYSFCCPGCVKKFNKNPKKYIKPTEQEQTEDQVGHEDHAGHDHSAHAH